VSLFLLHINLLIPSELSFLEVKSSCQRQKFYHYVFFRIQQKNTGKEASGISLGWLIEKGQACKILFTYYGT